MRTVQLPSGARIRGRALSDEPTASTEPAELLVALVSRATTIERRTRRPEALRSRAVQYGPLPDWPHVRIEWPDFGLPRDKQATVHTLRDALEVARSGALVEVACRGGKGRTGSALAVLAVLDGIPARDAVAWVRRHYHPQAVETPWQRWWIKTLRP